MKFKTILTSLLVAGCATQGAFAQSTDKSEKEKADYPHMFIGVQGGGQVTFTNYKATKLITPISTFSVGGMFTPAVGARLHVSGINEKGGLKSLDKTYEYKYVTSNLDLMLNLCNVFAPNKNHTLNAYLIGGVGLGYAWDNDDLKGLSLSASEKNLNLRWDEDRLVHNFRVGMQLEAELCRNVGLNLEVTANNLHDRFNSKLNGKGDWQVQAMLGLNFKFGFKKKRPAREVVPPVQEPVREEPKEVTPAPQPAPAPAPAPKPAPEKKAETKRVEVFFALNSATPNQAEEAKVKDLAAWLKAHPDAKVELTGYADAGTGNANVNNTISQKRVNQIAKLLSEKYGITASRISSAHKGDTVQPFSSNDANRVVIGLSTSK